nr:MAG TPA: hypothetical protein [Caudoviricetes sp.]
MLEELLRTLNNWFERDSLVGDFKVVGGALLVPEGFLKEGQYLRIIGSTFNDGLSLWPANDMVDEEFAGEVRALAVPPAVVSLSEQIEKWRADNQKALDAPYASESFGGYSYSKEGAGSSQGGSTGWRAHFRDQLNQWRKL